MHTRISVYIYRITALSLSHNPYIPPSVSQHIVPAKHILAWGSHLQSSTIFLLAIFQLLKYLYMCSSCYIPTLKILLFYPRILRMMLACPYYRAYIHLYFALNL